MYYDGTLRQRGAGLGDIFRLLTRTIAPAALRLGKNLVKQKAATLGPKAVKAGVGLVRDVMAKKTFKQAVKQRGKRLLSEAINMVDAPNKRQKPSRPRASRSSAATTKRRAKKKQPPRSRDIFD